MNNHSSEECSVSIPAEVEQASSENSGIPQESKALQLARWLTEKAVSGIGPLVSAEQLAQEYLDNPSYPDAQSRVASLIRWETSKNFTTGFITGLGGFITLPVTIPTAVGASWLVQARLVAAIAKLYGHNLQEQRVQTAILMVIIGQDIKEVLKQTGIKLGSRLTAKVIQKIPGTALTKINQLIGMRLLTKAGERGIINLTKMVPLVGGVIGGTFDAVTCRITGKAAQLAFCPAEPKELNSLAQR